MNRKIIIFILILSGIFVLLLVINIFMVGQRTKTTPTATNQPNIYIEPNTAAPSFNPQPKEELKLININPPEDPEGSKAYAPNTGVFLKFNKPINPEGVVVSVEPRILLSVKFENNNQDVFIQPAFPDSWKVDVLYTITIHKGTAALDGTTLNQDINYKLITKLQGGV